MHREEKKASWFNNKRESRKGRGKEKRKRTFGGVLSASKKFPTAEIPLNRRAIGAKQFVTVTLWRIGEADQTRFLFP